jgi:hypothetical protein
MGTHVRDRDRTIHGHRLRLWDADNNVTAALVPHQSRRSDVRSSRRAERPLCRVGSPACRDVASRRVAEGVTLHRFRVWVENDFEVEAANEDEARQQAMHDMAFGVASVAEVRVIRVVALPASTEQREGE